jgi:hypothetical protein
MGRFQLPQVVGQAKVNKPLLPRPGAHVLRYELRFAVSETGPQEIRTCTVDVNDTGDERTNRADAIVTASLQLDDEGIKHWKFQSCSKATS